MRLFILATPLLLVSTALARPAPLKRDTTSMNDLCDQLDGFPSPNSNFELNGQSVNGDAQKAQAACDILRGMQGMTTTAIPSPAKDAAAGANNLQRKRRNAKPYGKASTPEVPTPASLSGQLESAAKPVLGARNTENPAATAGPLPELPELPVGTPLKDLGKRQGLPTPALPLPTETVEKRQPGMPPLPPLDGTLTGVLPGGAMSKRCVEEPKGPTENKPSAELPSAKPEAHGNHEQSNLLGGDTFLDKPGFEAHAAVH